jgi:hypothetical protein
MFFLFLWFSLALIRSVIDDQEIYIIFEDTILKSFYNEHSHLENLQYKWHIFFLFLRFCSTYRHWLEHVNWSIIIWEHNTLNSCWSKKMYWYSSHLLKKVPPTKGNPSYHYRFLIHWDCKIFLNCLPQERPHSNKAPLTKGLPSFHSRF